MDFSRFFSPEVFGQGWVQLDELLLAFFLSSLIGLEREIRLKSAGLRTHALVGLGAALMMLVSKYGFSDILKTDGVSLDPSRVAAQIVSGIGFIGGGLIFVRKDMVHGLTTAATIWLTAGVGMACGGGLPLLAISATLGHFIIVTGYTRLVHRMLGVTNRLTIRYQIGTDIAGRVLTICTNYGFVVRSFNMKAELADPNIANMTVRVQGSKSVALLAELLSKLDGVASVNVNITKEDG